MLRALEVLSVQVRYGRSILRVDHLCCIRFSGQATNLKRVFMNAVLDRCVIMS